MRNECYEFMRSEDGGICVVGLGAYGEVKLARNVENGEVVAIKMIHGRHAKQEIDVHHRLNHRKIIRLINYYYEEPSNTTYMVLEHAPRGTLHDRIKYGYGQLCKKEVSCYFRDVCEAVNYLHSKNFMHRDIKPQNILLTKDAAKLCDFGFATLFELRSTVCGTFQYMAPEMIQGKPYDYKIDVWALGVLLFEMVQGVAPFRGNTGSEVLAGMRKPIIFSGKFSSDQIDLIRKILRVNANNRPKLQEILEHPYLQTQKKVPSFLNTKERTVKAEQFIAEKQGRIGTIDKKIGKVEGRVSPALMSYDPFLKPKDHLRRACEHLEQENLHKNYEMERKESNSTKNSKPKSSISSPSNLLRKQFNGMGGFIKHTSNPHDVNPLSDNSHPISQTNPVSQSEPSLNSNSNTCMPLSLLEGIMSNWSIMSRANTTQ